MEDNSQKRRSIFFMLIAIVVAGVLALFSWRQLELYVASQAKETQLEVKQQRENENSVPVLVIVQDVPKGTRLVRSLLSYMTVPQQFLPADFIPATDEAVAALEGDMLMYDAVAGKPLVWSLMESSTGKGFSDLIAPKRRAVTIQVDEISTFSGQLRPGDHIDIYYSYAGGSGKEMVPLLQKVLVLATDADINAKLLERQGTYPYTTNDNIDANVASLGSRQYSTITLDLSIEGASKLKLAQQLGSVQIVLRTKTDEELVEERTWSKDDLLGIGDKDKYTLIRGGSGSGLAEVVELDL